MYSKKKGGRATFARLTTFTSKNRGGLKHELLRQTSCKRFFVNCAFSKERRRYDEVLLEKGEPAAAANSFFFFFFFFVVVVVSS
jgi:hypothetical protein